MRATQRELAAVFGVTTRTVRRWDGDGLASAFDKRTGHYDVPSAIRWRIEREVRRAVEAAGAGNGPPPKAESDARWAAARAALLEREVETAREDPDVIPRSEVAAALVEARDRAIRAVPRDPELLGLMKPVFVDVAPQGREEAEAIDLLDALVRTVLDYVAADGDDPPEGWARRHLDDSLAYGDAAGRSLDEEERRADWHRRRGRRNREEAETDAQADIEARRARGGEDGR